MGHNSMPAKDFGLEVRHEIHAKGTCPMCELAFERKLDENEEYRCICGYFVYHAWSGEVVVDNHNIPKEEWVSRGLAAELGAKALREIVYVNPERRQYFFSEYYLANPPVGFVSKTHYLPFDDGHQIVTTRQGLIWSCFGRTWAEVPNPNRS